MGSHSPRLSRVIDRLMKLLVYDRSALKSYIVDAATIVVITASSSLAAYVWSSGSGVNSVREVHFGFGEVVSNLIDHGSYQSDSGYSAHRFPFIPVFLYLVSFVSESILITIVIKNLLVWFGTYLILTRLLGMRARWFYLLALLILISTRPSINLIDFEESLAPFFLLWLVVGLEKRHCVLFSVSLACLLLLKSSYWLPCLACALIWMSPLWSSSCLGNIRILITPMLIVICLGLAWSFWTYSTTGYFATPLNASSTDSYNLFKGVNSISNAVYPNFNNDTVDHLVKMRYGDPEIIEEKEAMSYWRQASIKIVVDDPWNYLDNLKSRLSVIVTRVNWSVNDDRLRQVQFPDPELLENLQSSFYDERVTSTHLVEHLKNAIVRVTHVVILILSILYLWRSRCKTLVYLLIPFLFVVSNLLIFVEPRHLFVLWTPLCYWTVCAVRAWFRQYGSISLSGVRGIAII